MKNFFTSDTHFNQQRTLTLSRRPFDSLEEMNTALVNNWNKIVSNEDTVYHLGDFGDPTFLKYLNGKIIYLIPGNYEDREGEIDRLKAQDTNNRLKVGKRHALHHLEDTDLWMTHEPVTKFPYDDPLLYGRDKFFLFGHIHRLGMIKRNGLNVGVDCHYFKPIGMDTIHFYKEAVRGFYDENVFSSTVKGV